MPIINWIKSNKLSSFLLLIFFLLIFKNVFTAIFAINTSGNISSRNSYETTGMNFASVSNQKSLSNDMIGIPPVSNLPPSNSQNRLVIQDSTLSLVVKNVRESADKIINYAQENNGFMVNSNLSNPDEVASANIVVRIPTRKLNTTLEYFRGLAIKVVSENLNGEDVTDQYTDLKARLQTLNTTKAKFEDILVKATVIQDILTVQREIINLQSEIDSLRGQDLYLQKSAELSKITIYLSTDEFSLPYAPSESWRPEVIFKQAVRSLVGTGRSIGTFIIWILVYSPIMIIIFFIYKFLRQKFSQKTV